MTRKTRKKPAHHEDIEARALWKWAQYVPELRDYLYHIPNGGKRGRIDAALMKAQGVRAGVSDYHLPLARGQFIGLWIELKAPRPYDALVTKCQYSWGKKMEQAGHLFAIAEGWTIAKKIIEWYLSLPKRAPWNDGPRIGKSRAK